MSRLITIRQLDGSEAHLSDRDLPLTIGSGPHYHIRFPGDGGETAYIDDAQGHLFVQPAAQPGAALLHNDRRLDESAWLKSGDTLHAGPFMVRFQRSGDRFVFSVAERQAETPVLSPPPFPPPGVSVEYKTGESLPVEIPAPAGASAGKKLGVAALALFFLLLSGGVLYVLLARPLEVMVSPEPDTVAVTGRFPAVRIGGRYLLLPAVYAVAVEKKGYRDFRTEVRGGRDGQGTLQVTLEKLPGRLNLRLTPADGVQVHSGERLLGTTPPATLAIAPGPHRLTLSKPRYRPHTADIVIEGGDQIQDLEVALEPDWADITIGSAPAGAEVLVDGAPAGATPLTTALLSGTRRIELRLQSYTPQNRPVEVEAGVAADYFFELTPLPGTLALSSTPAGAAVSVDGRYQGITPLLLSLPSGRPQGITLARPGYLPLNRSVTLAPGEERELQLTMEEARGVVFLTTIPVDASVTINGDPLTAPPGALTLPARPQTFVVSAPGHRTVTRTLTPNPDFSQQLVIELPAEAAAGQLPPLPAGDRISLTTAAGQRLRLLQPAPLLMGAPRREPGRRANERERLVTMTRPFLISETLVSNAEFRKFDATHRSGSFAGHSLDGDSQPVVNVTWEQAVAYLNWLSEQDGLEPFYHKEGDGYRTAAPPTTGYRLPSEAEWAFAARQAGVKERQRYPWPGGFPPDAALANLGDESARTILPRVIPGYHDGFPVTSPVGHFPANPAGLFDIGGNASEWCHDYYSAYTGELAEETDPLGPETGAHRVIRGSSWKDATLTETRLSYRAYHKEARDSVGFRLARYP